MLLAAADIHLVVQRRQAADLVMPSKLPNIMAAGRAFIATARLERNWAGSPLSPRRACWRRRKMPASLAQAIRRLAADAGLRERLSVRGRQYAEAHWGREQLLGQWEELLLSLVGRGLK